ncbi:hypothetical protein [Clostridium kluyveri]|uniref:Uncharacterized protein n=2 Tax=Clostridium kluyveri TaxID=1534 RepID=A5F9Q6_CLOK5|nr:hypothetical protein [Clostridium kluyveri]ABQ23604.1 hypothetical protein CKL_4005 [Clostridium kluyveri DSM 555]
MLTEIKCKTCTHYRENPEYDCYKNDQADLCFCKIESDFWEGDIWAASERTIYCLDYKRSQSRIDGQLGKKVAEAIIKGFEEGKRIPKSLILLKFKRVKEIVVAVLQFISECLLLGMCVSGVMVSAVLVILEDSYGMRLLWVLLSGAIIYLLIVLIMSVTNKWKKVSR